MFPGKMALHFCANLSFMFQENPSLLARYALAKSAGFRAVECAFPYDVPLPDLVAVKNETGLEQILINAPPGDWSKGERGLAALPGREADFDASISLAVKYATALKCKRVHVMSGVVGEETDKNFSTYVKNLQNASKQFQDNGIVGLIEPINKYVMPTYFLNSYEKAVSVLKEVNSPNLKLQLDLFHLQHISGNVTKNIENLLPFVGHIQIAQVPDRHEPDTAGELNYEYIFSLLKKLNYDGWIGLEYAPANKTEDGLQWLQKIGL